MLVLASCGDSGDSADDDSPGVDAGIDPNNPDHEVDPLAGFPEGSAQLAILCGRNNGDLVSRAFCGDAAPTIESIADLQELLGIDFVPGHDGNGDDKNAAFALTGHSTSLVARSTSPINPRAIIWTPSPTVERYVMMGFARGEQFIELVANDPTRDNELTFFLFRFHQACNEQPGGCTPGDLLTPAIESNFTSYSLYQDVDIKNTALDCLQCHQRGGPGTKKILRMQELRSPWGHWMSANLAANNLQTLTDYKRAHAAGETYAGIPGKAIPNSSPKSLMDFLDARGFGAQPNEFDSAQILDQGATPAWRTLYANAQSGEQIPPPYHANRITDPFKLRAMADAYKAVATNEMPAAMLPDIRDVFLDSAMPDLSFRPATSLVEAGDGRGIIVQMCGQCHSPKLDQTISRASFDVTKLDTMSRSVKDRAIKRLTLPKEAFRRMPPTRFRELSLEEIELVTAELNK
ncbi:MAG: hypothetical protein AB7P03_05045 [Kofleriaceae bacterium]